MTTFRQMKAQLNAIMLLNTRILTAKEFPNNAAYFAKYYGASVTTANTLKSNPTRKTMEAAVQYWKDMFIDFVAQLPDGSMVKQEIMQEMEALSE